MIRQEILEDLRKELDEITDNNFLQLTSDYTYSEKRQHHQEHLAKNLIEYGVIQYTDKLTPEEEDLDDKGVLQEEYSKYLMENEL